MSEHETAIEEKRKAKEAAAEERRKHGILMARPSMVLEPKPGAPVPLASDSKETVNHPSHYHPDGIEAIDVIEDWDLGFCEGNVVKYIARWRGKGGLEDLEKARFYLNRLIKNAEGES
jgi:hypothetical protein